MNEQASAKPNEHAPKTPDFKASNTSLNKGKKAARAHFHDYKAPGYYLITITTYPNSPILSEITQLPISQLKKGEMIIPKNTPLGDCVRNELFRLTDKCPNLRILRYVIMPDHIHFLLHVASRLGKSIGSFIASFSSSCSRASSQIQGLPSVSTLFQPFDDSIIFTYNQLDRAIKYIEDNPRRNLIKRHNPNLFRRRLNLRISDHTYAAYGNMFLLRESHLLPIRIHRRWSEREFSEYTERCLRQIDNGAIPISPAIHNKEKEIVRYAMEAANGVILLQDLSFSDRFKPTGEYFNLCASGRLLLLSPWPENLQRRSNAGYSEFHLMNDFANHIANLPASARISMIEA